jgi:hypothetical protein
MSDDLARYGFPLVDESKLPAPPQRSGLEPLPPGYYPKGD